MAGSGMGAPTAGHRRRGTDAGPTDTPLPPGFGHDGSVRRLTAPAVVTFLVVAGVIVVTVSQLDPAQLVSSSTITGGDTGAHVALAWFLKSTLLPHLHVTGWDPGAYDGFPLYTFYFPVPDLLAALLGLVIPFAVAFKLVTVLGSVTLP